MRTALALAIVCAAVPARANPADLFGIGARGPAMGGAQVAAADDATANYYNPALMARLDDIRIELGYQAALPSLQVDNQDLEVDAARGVDINLAVPGMLGGARLAFGAALYLPDQQITRLRNQSAQQPRFIEYDNLPQRIMLAANVAMAIGERLSLGVGISYMSSTKGTIKLRGLIGLPQPDDSQLDLAMDVDLKTIRYAVAGLAYRLKPWLDVGVSYRGGFTLVVDLAFGIRGNVGTPGQPPVVTDGHFDLTTVSQDLFQPAQYTAGFAARITPRFLLAFDLAYHRWSTFQNPSAHIDIDLDVGQFNDLVKIPPFAALPDPNFHDIVVPRLGMEWLARQTEARALRIRAGYVYQPSPAPEQVGETNFIDDDRHIFSVGAGLELRHGLGAIVPRPLSLDAFVGLTALEPRQHRKLSPVDPIGDYRSGGHIWSLGFLSRWRF